MPENCPVWAGATFSPPNNNVVHPPGLSVNESHLIEGSFLAKDQEVSWFGRGKWEANPTLSAVDNFLLSQQDRCSISKKSYLPSSGELGAPPLASSKGPLEQLLDQRTPVRDHRGAKGTELKGGEEQHPHCGASHPFVLVSPRGFERCHPSNKLRTGPLWSLQPATSFCQWPTTLSPPPPPLIPTEWPTAPPSFFLQDATLHLALRTFPGADLFVGDCWSPGPPFCTREVPKVG